MSDRLLRPDRLDVDPNTADAADTWDHWLRTFKTYLASVPTENINKLDVLVNFLAPSVYKHIKDCDLYEMAIEALQNLYVKPKNEIFARHLLATAKQNPGQTLDEFVQNLKSLANDCNFTALTVDENRDCAIRDAFIAGLHSNQIRQRLLENRTLDLRMAIDQARSLDMAQKQSLSYLNTASNACGSTSLKLTDTSNSDSTDPDDNTIASTASNSKCFFCGYARHPRSRCPAKDALCKNCGKKGHFQKVCQSKTFRRQDSTSASLCTSFTAAAPHTLSKATVGLIVNNTQLKALIDTGSSESFICSEKAKYLKVKVHPSTKAISMASTKLSSKTEGHCFVTMQYQDENYESVKLSLLPGLCADIILGHDFLSQHKTLEMHFKGPRAEFSVCSLTAAKVETPSLFSHLLPECRPIATKSRRFSVPDTTFIEEETTRLLRDDIIEPSKSPWRAQVLVTTNERHKKRMVVDYSQTINRFTQLDAYPLPRIDDMIEKISHYEVFSTLDLQSAYHQIPIKEEERPYTAFEAAGNLYHFKRIPFGVTNGVACFQRVIDDIIRTEKLEKVFAYVDNVTICGESKEEHDENLKNFLSVAKKYDITFNDTKSIIATDEIKLLGYLISKGNVRPDPDRLKPLREMPEPHDLKSQQRIVGLFSYYSNWISHFSDKIHPLVENKIFPIPKNVNDSFEKLKQEIEKACITTVDYNSPLVVETDASDIAIAATLNQNGRPVAFFSRTLNSSERNHSSVEKEAYAIVEALRKWKHYLLPNHFKLVTDQRSVAFMYDLHKGKIKNEKIQRWRIEMSCFSYDVIYRPGKHNQAADALSRSFCSGIIHNNSTNTLKSIHESLCHPGVTRMFHFVKTRNLPFSTDDVKREIAKCKTCAELKPSFVKARGTKLIKATHPFERLSVDFKGPLPSASQNRYLLTVIDEYSRFPFAFPCKDISTATVIKCFCQLFSLFGMPLFVHSDRGSSFMSTELKTFLHEKGIATSRTTPFNPQGNGQVERLNGTLWKSITLALKSQNLPVSQWESVLQDALHSIRSLLCTSTNETPHERLFRYDRKSTTGTSMPSWLTSSNKVLLKRNVRASKYEPLVDEVDLIEANPLYAHVKLPDGRETTVSVRQLAPVPETATDGSNLNREIEPGTLPNQEEPNSIVENSIEDVENSDVSGFPNIETNEHFVDNQNTNSHNRFSKEHSPNELEPIPHVVFSPTQSNRKMPFVRTRPYNLRNREA